MRDKYLVVENLTKSFDDKKISASFNLEKGSAISLLGPSGCGKSTVLGMIAGFVKADEGSVFLDGVDITNLKPYERNVGMVFQNYALFSHLNVFENVAFGLRSQGLNKDKIKANVLACLEKFSIVDLQKRSVQNLSGGEKQRVALARTLVTSPKLVLFDEPLSALDADLRKELRHELRETQEREAYCAVYVTHDLEEASFLADELFRF
ncbi:MAG: ABC transporter ATP-binding protein [Treponemataceae bacterium]